MIGRSAFLDKNLNKSTGFRRPLPGQTALAGCELDRDIANPLCLASLENDVLGKIVALVEQAQRRHAVLYWGAVFVFDDLARYRLPSHFAGDFGRFWIRSVTAPTRCQRQGRQ